MISPYFIAAFTDELDKIANTPVAAAAEHAAAPVAAALSQHGSHLLAAGLGATGLYGANKVYQDAQLGRQIRKQQGGY